MAINIKELFYTMKHQEECLFNRETEVTIHSPCSPGMARMKSKGPTNYWGFSSTHCIPELSVSNTPLQGTELEAPMGIFCIFAILTSIPEYP